MAQLTRNQLRLVHIEDNPDFAELCGIHLRLAGFTKPIAHFDNGVEAIDYFLTLNPERKPHAVVLDLHLPGMDGLEVLRWLRYDYSECDLAVYLLTSSDDMEHRRQAAESRVTRYLLKTHTVSNLIAELDLLILRENRMRNQEAAMLAGGRGLRANRGPGEVPTMLSAEAKATASFANGNGR